MINNYNNTLFFLPTSSFEIQEEISNSKLKYSNHSSDINMFVIKKISIEISPMLSYFFKGTSATRFIIKKMLFYFFLEKICIIDYFDIYTSKNCDINHHISI